MQTTNFFKKKPTQTNIMS